MFSVIAHPTAPGSVLYQRGETAKLNEPESSGLATA